MRILTLNVLMGGDDRLLALGELVAQARPDVVVLQECLGWADDGGERLGRMARAAGIPNDPGHVVLGLANARPSGSRYHVAVLSRPPILRSETHRSGFAHCAVEVEVETAPAGTSCVVFGAHLASSDEDTRLAELGALLRILPSNSAAKGLVLTGDLNSLARHDPYPHDIDARLARAGITKYGQPTRFDVVDRLLRAGFVDALHQRGAGRLEGQRWVTARRVKNGEAVDLRTDYAFVSPSLASHVVTAEVLPARGASDHDALVVEVR